MEVDIDGLKKMVDLRVFIKDRYLPDAKVGNVKYTALCPFHNDQKRPNFLIYERRFHCYGCGQNGDIFDIIQHFERCDIKSAIKMVSEIVGVSFNGSQHMRYSLNAEDMKLFRVVPDEIENCENIPDLLKLKLEEINREIIDVYSVADESLKSALKAHGKKMHEKLMVLTKRFAKS